jgi:TP901 family phage tail tape measure protein
VAEVIKTVVDVELNTGQFSSELRTLQQQINAFNLTLNKSQAVQGQASKLWADNLAQVINRTGFFKAELGKIQTSAAALDSTLKKGQASLGQFFSAAFNKRGAMAAEVFALASERARTMQTQFIATGRAAKGMQEVLAIRPLTAFTSEISTANQRMQILSSMFKQGTTQLINFGKNVQWAGRQLMVGFTVPLTIFGTTAGRVFMDLEKQVVSFKKVYGDMFTTPAELNANLEAVKGLAAEYTKYGISVKDTISLAAQAAAAGRQNSDLTDAVRESTRLATLGQMDQNSALETTIALQSAFRLSGQDLSDTINFLNMVENQTVVSLQDIAAAVPRVAPVIQGLGGDVKDLTVFLAAMQEGGVSAEQGANALKSGLASLINPSKSATEFLGKFGVNLDYIVQQNRGDLMGTVLSFASALQTLDEFTRQQALENVFGKFQYARLAPLFDNITRSGSQASQVMDTMGFSSEQLASTANKELSTIEQSFGVQLTGAIERFKLAIAPIGELFVKMSIPVVNMLTKIADWFNKLPDGVKNFGALATVIVGVVVPAATMMFGLFMNLVGTLAKMTQGIVVFGATWKSSGLIAGFQTLTQSSKYLSLSEIDAANAAKQLGSATAIANQAILNQATTQNSSRVAIDAYTNALLRQIAAQKEASLLNPTMFARGAGAAGLAKNVIKRSTGGVVPGSGNTDTVPAMLTGGEFVVNKQATKQNFSLLKAINNGMNAGGIVKGNRNAYGYPPSDTQLKAALEKFVSESGWSGPNKNLEDKKSYMAFKEAISVMDNKGFSQERIEREFITPLRASAAKNAKNNIGSQPVYRIFEDIFGIPNVKGPLKDKAIQEKLGGFNIRELGTKTHASHTTMSSASTLQTPIGPWPAGYPIQKLTNRVIDLPDWMNIGLEGDGVKASKIKDYIEANKKQIFATQGQQFANYLSENKIDGDDAKRALSIYNEHLDRVADNLVKELGKKGDGLISDSGKIGTSSLTGVANDAYRPFAYSSNVMMKNFHDAIRTESVLRSPTAEMIENALKLRGITPKGTQIENAKLLLNSLGVKEGSKEYENFMKNTYLEKGTIRLKPVTMADPRLSKTLMAMFYENAAKAIKRKGFNKGGLASTNKDTVPAMLTPGEFVINKKSAQENMPLLQAINKGQRLNKGGVVNGVLYAQNGTPDGVPNIKFTDFGISPVSSGPTSSYSGNTQAAMTTSGSRGASFKGAAPGIGGAVAGMALFMPLMKAGEQLAGTMGGLAASLVGTTYASGLVRIGLGKLMGSPVKLSEQFRFTSKALSRVGPVFGKIGLAGAGWIGAAAGAAVVTYKVVKTMNDIRNAGARLSEAMSGGVNSVNNMAAAFGRQTPTQKLTSLRAQAAGGAISQEAQQQASQFMGTDAAKELVKNIEEAKKNGEDAVESLRNQLARSILAGVITPEEARGVAVEIGNALNDQKLAIDASGAITQLIGPNGELIKDNRVKILGEIAPTIDPASLRKIAEDQYKAQTSGFWGPLVKLVDDQSKEISINSTRALAEGVKNYALIQKQNMDNVEVQFIEGLITVEQYNKEIQDLENNARDFSAKGLNSFLELTGSTDLDEFNRILKETKTVTGPRGGDITYLTDQAKAAQKQVGAQVKELQDAYFSQYPNIAEEQKQSILNGMREAFGGNDSTEIITGWAGLLSGLIKSSTITGLSEGTPDGIRPRVTTPIPTTGETPPVVDPSAKESAYARIKRETEETKKYSTAVRGLLSSGLKPENIALLNQADLLEMSNSQRKQTIKLLKEQQNTSKVLQFIMMSSEEQNIKNLNDSVKLKDYEMKVVQRQIDAKERLNQVEQDRIDVLDRQNELDKRDVDSRSRALDQIGKKEETINGVYNARFEALDKVSQINDRLAQQQQDRISLAGALTSGDFGAAASAAVQMSSNYASNQLQDTRSALESQQQAEVASLTAEVNGQLLTKQQIQIQIDEINERIYQRDIQILNLEDIIFQREQESLPFKKQLRDLEDQRLKITQQLEDAEFNKWKTELDGINKAIQAYNQLWIAKTKGTGSTVGTNTKASEKKAKGKTFGGFIRAANGMEVPGTGITDKVPALLTPGEFVVRKSAAQANMPLLKALNGNVFPKSGSLVESTSTPVIDSSVSTVNAPVYNNYSINVSVAETNASADEIAGAVMTKIKMNQNRSIRRSRV